MCSVETAGSTDVSDGNTTGVKSPSYLFKLLPTSFFYFLKVILDNGEGKHAKSLSL